MPSKTVRQGISHKLCRLLQRADGYKYEFTQTKQLTRTTKEKQTQMPLLPTQNKPTLREMKFKLPVETIADLEAYAIAIHSDASYVITQAIAKLTADKAFREWKASNQDKLRLCPEIPTRKPGAGRPKKNSAGNSNGNSEAAELTGNFSPAGNSERISEAS